MRMNVWRLHLVLNSACNKQLYCFYFLHNPLLGREGLLFDIYLKLFCTVGKFCSQVDSFMLLISIQNVNGEIAYSCLQIIIFFWLMFLSLFFFLNKYQY